MTLLNPHNNPGFHKLPICLMEYEDLPLSAVVVYSVMLSRYNMFNNEQKLYYDSYEQIAEHSKLSRATTAANVKILIDIGLVLVDKIKSKSVLFNKNVWTVNTVFPDNKSVPIKKIKNSKTAPKPAKDFGSFELSPADINAEINDAYVDNLDMWVSYD